MKKQKEQNKVISRVSEIKQLLIFGGVFFLAAIVLFVLMQPKVGQKIENKVDNVLGTEATKLEAWWNPDYKYKRQIAILNQSEDLTVEANQVVDIEIDHEALVKNKQSEIKAADFALVHFADGQFAEVDFDLTNPNTSTMKVSFKLIKEIKPREIEEGYFIYYGNDFAEIKYKKLGVIEKAENINYVLDTEKANLIMLSLSRKWVLKDTKSFEEYSKLIVTTKLNPEMKIEGKPNYEISSVQNRTEIETIEQFQVNITDLEPGNYDIRVTVVDQNGDIHKSARYPFIVSYPLYVAWTMDWEGMDTTNATLDEATKFSQKYDVPIVHFWNPRLYIPGFMSQDRVDYLENWVKSRTDNGRDEMGLHLHMFYDVVAAAGVEVKKDPQWASRNSGSDIPMFIYSYEEQKQILEWGMKQFADNGLNAPKVFRAGGWMSDANTLQALEELNFKVESSGRTGYALGEYLVQEQPEPIKPVEENSGAEVNLEELNIYGTENTELEKPNIRIATNEEIALYTSFLNGGFVPAETQLPIFTQSKVVGKWDLKSTTKPYKPSKFNINSSAGTTYNIWEYPNNGSDSWKFSTAELTRRFNDNYSGEALKERQLLTYLTHPHAIQVDMQKLNPTFDKISQNLAKDDNGAVVFSNFQEYYQDSTGELY